MLFEEEKEDNVDIDTFVEITNENREDAREILKICKGDLELATNIVFDTRKSPQKLTEIDPSRPGTSADIEVERRPTVIREGDLVDPFIKTEILDEPEYVEQVSDLSSDAAAILLHVSLVLPMTESSEYKFRVDSSMKLERLKKAYSEKIGVPVYLLRFFYDGRRITDDSTPSSLDMETGSVIEVFEENLPGTFGQKSKESRNNTALSNQESASSAGRKRTHDSGQDPLDTPGPSSECEDNIPIARKKSRESVTCDGAKDNRDSQQKIDVITKELEDLKKKYARLVNNIRDKVECPVCLTVPRRAPVPICVNGHVVCESCIQPSCPTCRAEMGGTSILAVTIIDNIEHPCDWEGCTESRLLSEMPDHARKCYYRKVVCPGLFCKKTYPLYKLMDHVLLCSVGGRKPFEYRMPHEFSFTLESDLSSIGRGDIFWKLEAIKFKGSIFFLKVFRSSGHWYFLVQMQAGEEECENFTLSMTVQQGGDDSEGQRFSRAYTGEICPIDVSRFDEIESKDLCLKLTDKLMRKIVRKSTRSECFKFHVEVNLKKVNNSICDQVLQCLS